MALRLKKRKVKSLANVCSKLPTYGNPKASILFAVDPVIFFNRCPDDPTAQVFDGKHYKHLVHYLKQNGVKKDDVFFVAVAPPCSSETWKRDKLLNEHLKFHKYNFDEIVKAVNPKLIVCAGKSASRQVFGKAVQITKIRGVPTKLEHQGNRLVLPILSAPHVMRVPDLIGTYTSDMATLGRLRENGYSLRRSIPKVTKNYRWVTDLDFFIKRKPKYVSADVETTGGMLWHDNNSKILTVQLCDREGEAYMVPIDYHYNGKPIPSALRSKLVKQLKQLFEDPDIHFFGHNFKYDWLMLKSKLGIEVANYTDDTLLLVHALDENMISKSLDDCVRVYVPEMSGFNDVLNNDPEHENKTRMDLFSQDKLLAYGCGDVDADFRLHKVLKKKLQQDKRAYNSYRRITMPAIRAFCDIEQEGFTVNRKELEKFEQMLRQHQKTEYKRLIQMIPNSIRQMYVNTGVGLRLNRPELLRSMLFTHRDGLRLQPLVFTKTSTEDNKIPSVSTKQHLPYFADNPFVAGIIDYVKNEKLLNTYVKGFYKYIRDGKVRPSYLLHGTVTGRTSSKDPNGQNFPKRGKLAKQYRKIFVAPPGWTLVEADFSQIELRIAAIMANEPTMLKVYRDGGDIHIATAAGVMGISVKEFMKLPPDVQEQKRFQAKAVNFGFIYGMWWPKFKIYAKTEYGIDYTDRQAEATRTGYFNTYRNLENWHREVVNFVREHGYVRSIDGRVRHLPSAFSSDESVQKQAQRQGINSPVQCFGNQLGLMSLARINKSVPKDKVRICGFIHDAGIFLVKDEYAMRACVTIKRFMETNPLEKWFGFKSPIPILADVSIGKSLAEMVGLGKKWNELVNDKSVKTTSDIYEKIGYNVIPKKEGLMRRKRKIKLRLK